MSSSLPTMDVSLRILLSSFRIETLSFKTESGSEREDEGDERTPSSRIPLVSYFFSNLACSTTLDMLANGAEGTDRDNLISHFHGKPLGWVNEIVPYTLEFLNETGNAGGPKINLARGIWVDRSIELKTVFQDMIQRFYKPDFSSTEFKNTMALKSEVNKWIEEKTGGLIEDPLGSTVIGADTRLIFTSALEFEGEWFEPFEDAGVQQFKFLNGEVVSLPFMTTNRKHYVQQFKNYKLLSVPFKQKKPSRFSMLFYLPDNMEAFDDLLLFIGLEEIAIMDVYFPEEQVQVGNFLIPKFSLTVSGPLLFDPPYDFEQMANSSTGMISRGGLISKGGMLSSFLEINERGTRAAGVSCIFVDKKLTEPDSGKVAPSLIKNIDKNIDFVANRQFIFFIRDNQFGRMLFSGALISPAGQSASFKAIGE